jgi:hypothetical protein
MIASAGVERPAPSWLLPQLLSFDAPLVAALWLTLFARVYGGSLHFTEPLLVAAAVWLIYAIDHLLDVRSGAVCSARHRFVRAHSRAFRLGIAAVVFASIALTWVLPEAIRERGVALSAIVLLYFAAVHHGGDWLRRIWPKELVMGAVFAAGCSIPAWDDFRQAWPTIVLFAILCTLNCAALDLWEWPLSDEPWPAPHPATRFLGRHLVPISAVVSIVSTLMVIDVRNEIFAAVALSGLLLLVLNYFRARIQIEAARMLADAALLTPLLFLWR